jgi:nucleotide-binding universal stress UspA family protein
VNIKEVVFPVDFSQRSVEACPYVAAVTRRFGAKLTLLHVVESAPPPSSPSDPLDTASETLRVRQQAANNALAAFQQQYIPHVPSEAVVLAGDPAACIVTYAGDSKDRLIVMPTHGYGLFRKMLLGSVAAKVLHDARSPVLTGPHFENAVDPKQWFTFKRILCAIALDWESDEILKQSGALAAHVGAELIATHVITPVEEGLISVLDPAGPPLSTESAPKAMYDALQRAGVSAQVDVLVGEPSRGVAAVARQHHADLIVIGRGGTPDSRGRLGAHSYAIVRRAPCPVLCLATT